MEPFLESLKEKIRSKRSFILYIALGFTGLILDLITFIILVRVFHVNELVANPISASIGIVNNFFLNAYINFKKTDKIWSRLLSFYSVGVVGIIVGDLFLWFFNGIVKVQLGAMLLFISPLLVKYQIELIKAVSIVFIAVMQYFLNKRISFKE